jgi:hypothetical protein
MSISILFILVRYVFSTKDVDKYFEFNKKFLIRSFYLVPKIVKKAYIYKSKDKESFSDNISYCHYKNEVIND